MYNCIANKTIFKLKVLLNLLMVYIITALHYTDMVRLGQPLNLTTRSWASLNQNFSADNHSKTKCT